MEYQGSNPKTSSGEGHGPLQSNRRSPRFLVVDLEKQLLTESTRYEADPTEDESGNLHESA